MQSRIKQLSNPTFRRGWVIVVFAVMLGLVSCTSLPQGGVTHENLIVFPAEVKADEALVTSPEPSESLLARYGIAPQADLEKVLANAWNYSSENKPREAARVMALFYRRLQAHAVTVNRIQLTALLHSRAFWLEDAGEVQAPRAILEFSVDMLQDVGAWQKQVPVGIQVVTDDPDDDVAYYLAKSLANLSLLLSSQGKITEAWPLLQKALELYGELQDAPDAGFFGVAFMRQAFQAKDYGTVLQAVDPLLDVLTASLDDTDPNVLSQVGVLSGLSQAMLGDLSGAMISLRNYTNLVDSVGYPSAALEPVKEVITEVKSLLVSRIQAGNATLEESILADDEGAVKTLVARGADVNKVLENGRTPLLLACTFTDNTRIAELLIVAGADVNAEGPARSTPLAMTAGFADRLDLLNLLLARGAKVNQASPQGWTPLMLAARRGSSPAVVAALLAAGASPQAQTLDGVTALQLSQQGSHANPEVEKILTAALAAK